MNKSNKMIQKFWRNIAKDIEQQEDSAPKSWKKNRIEAYFLPKLSEKVTRLCNQDKEKARLCNKRYGQPISSSYDTFRRYILLSPPETGDAKTRHIYAIYFGYKSFEDYCLHKNIQLLEEKEVSEDQIAKDNLFNIKEDTSKKNEKIKQINFFSFFNKSLAKRVFGKLSQINLFSIGNKQEVDNRKDV